MRFSINSNVLLENLMIIQRGLPVKTTMPVLNGIKIECSGKEIKLTSSSSDLSVYINLIDESIDIIEEGNAIISGRLFIDIIRKLQGSKVEICAIEDNLVSITSDRSEFKLKTFNYYDYPQINFIESEDPLLLSSETLKEIIEKVGYASSQTEKRPILTGVNIKCENNIVTAIATDSYRLNKKIIYLKDKTRDFNIVIPSKSLDELYKIIDNFKNELEIYTTNNKILFKIENIYFQTRLLEGNFPDTSRIIPSTFAVKIKFNRIDLLQAVERISLLNNAAKDFNYNLISLKLRSDNVVELTTVNQNVGDGFEEIIPLEVYDGTILKLSISSKYLLDSLKSFQSNEVVFNFTGETRPFIIVDLEDDNYLNLILPTRYE